MPALLGRVNACVTESAESPVAYAGARESAAASSSADIACRSQSSSTYLEGVYHAVAVPYVSLNVGLTWRSTDIEVDTVFFWGLSEKNVTLPLSAASQEMPPRWLGSDVAVVSTDWVATWTSAYFSPSETRRAWTMSFTLASVP